MFFILHREIPEDIYAELKSFRQMGKALRLCKCYCIMSYTIICMI